MSLELLTQRTSETPHKIEKQAAEITPAATVLQGGLRSLQKAAEMVVKHNEENGKFVPHYIRRVAELKPNIAQPSTERIIQTRPRTVQKAAQELAEQMRKKGEVVPDYVSETAKLKVPVATMDDLKTAESETVIDTHSEKLKKYLLAENVPSGSLEHIIKSNPSAELNIMLQIKKVTERMSFLKNQIEKFQSETFEEQRFTLQREYGSLVALKGQLESTKSKIMKSNLN